MLEAGGTNRDSGSGKGTHLELGMLMHTCRGAHVCAYACVHVCAYVCV